MSRGKKIPANLEVAQRFARVFIGSDKRPKTFFISYMVLFS